MGSDRDPWTGAPRRRRGQARPRPFKDAPSTALTLRQIEVLELVARGWTNPEIARRMHLSDETVKSHLRMILAKLQAASRAHAVTRGFQYGWLEIISDETERNWRNRLGTFPRLSGDEPKL